MNLDDLANALAANASNVESVIAQLREAGKVSQADLRYEVGAAPGRSPAPEGKEAMSTVYRDIKAERERQDKKWGGPEHDDGHNREDWVAFIQEHSDNALRGDEFRRRMIEVAALAIAAVESHDRAAERAAT